MSGHLVSLVLQSTVGAMALIGMQFVLFIHLILFQSTTTTVTIGLKGSNGYCSVTETSVDLPEISIRENCTHLVLRSVNFTLELLDNIVSNRLISLSIFNSSVDMFRLPSNIRWFRYDGIRGSTTQIIIDEDVYKLETMELLRLSQLPANIGQLSKLEKLSCERAREVNFDLMELSGMLQLHTIGLLYIASVTIPGSIYLPSLKVLYIVSSPVKFSNNASFEFPNLETLHLHNNSLQLIPDQISALTTLKNLKICNNKLRYVHLDVFANLSRLEILSLTDSQISKITTENQVKLVHLRRLSLASNKLTSLNATLWIMPALEFLSLDNNQLYRVEGLLELFTGSLRKFIWRVNNSVTFIAKAEGGCPMS